MQRHYDFYVHCMQIGYLPNVTIGHSTGLCGAADYGQIDNDILKLFEPTDEDEYEMRLQGIATGWWGYEVPCDSPLDDFHDKLFQFTTLRQTIVLFMACIAEEEF